MVDSSVFIAPNFIPASLYNLAQQLQSAFRDKTIDVTLLIEIGQQLWACSGLPKDISHISQLVIQQYQDLPWEYLYHPDGYFIAQDIAIIRQSVTTFTKNRQTALPFNILHFSTQVNYSKQHYLNFSEERQFIYQALWPQIQAQQVLLHSSTCHRLEQFKDLLNQRWDMIILSGHSVTQEGQQYLAFNSDTAPYLLVSYEEIVTIFQNLSVQCVVLAVCESNDLTFKLHRLGIPCVIGMQYTVLDRAASLFIQQFCQSIMQQSTVTDAAQTARLAMQNLLKQDEQWQENELGQWLMPCLYVQTQTFPLFSQQTPDTQTKPVKQLIGRSHSFCELEKLLLNYKKVWLYGIGGIGKTALAQALQQHFMALHKPITYLEVAEQNDITNIDSTILAVSRFPPPNQEWISFKLSSPSEVAFMHYAQYLGLAYPALQLRLIYKMLQGNYQGLHLLQGLPFSTQAHVLRQQLRTVQRYLQAYQRQ